MSAYPPPTSQSPNFNPTFFATTTTTAVVNSSSQAYLQYPTAQGSETFTGNSGNNQLVVGASSVQIGYDKLTTPKGIEITGAGFYYDNGDVISTTTWANLQTKVEAVAALAPATDATTLNVNDAITIQNGETPVGTNTIILSTSAGYNQLLLNDNAGTVGQVLTSGGEDGSLTWSAGGGGGSQNLASVLAQSPAGAADPNQSIYLTGTSGTPVFSNVGVDSTINTSTVVHDYYINMSYTDSDENYHATCETGAVYIQSQLSAGDTSYSMEFVNYNSALGSTIGYGNQLFLNDNAGTIGQVLTSGGATGSLSWTTPSNPTLANVLTAGSTADLNQSMSFPNDTLTYTGANLTIMPTIDFRGQYTNIPDQHYDDVAILPASITLHTEDNTQETYNTNILTPASVVLSTSTIDGVVGAIPEGTLTASQLQFINNNNTEVNTLTLNPNTGIVSNYTNTSVAPTPQFHTEILASTINLSYQDNETTQSNAQLKAESGTASLTLGDGTNTLILSPTTMSLNGNLGTEGQILKTGSAGMYWADNTSAATLQSVLNSKNTATNTDGGTNSIVLVDTLSNYTATLSPDTFTIGAGDTTDQTDRTTVSQSAFTVDVVPAGGGTPTTSSSLEAGVLTIEAPNYTNVVQSNNTAITYDNGTFKNYTTQDAYSTDVYYENIPNTDGVYQETYTEPNYVYLAESDGTTENITILTATTLSINGDYGTAGQVLTSGDVGGVLSWTTVGGGGSQNLASVLTEGSTADVNQTINLSSIDKGQTITLTLDALATTFLTDDGTNTTSNGFSTSQITLINKDTATLTPINSVTIANNGIVYYDDTPNQIVYSSKSIYINGTPGTTGDFLTSGGDSGPLTWTTPTVPALNDVLAVGNTTETAMIIADGVFGGYVNTLFYTGMTLEKSGLSTNYAYEKIDTTSDYEIDCSSSLALNSDTITIGTSAGSASTISIGHNAGSGITASNTIFGGNVGISGKLTLVGNLFTGGTAFENNSGAGSYTVPADAGRNTFYTMVASGTATPTTIALPTDDIGGKYISIYNIGSNPISVRGSSGRYIYGGLNGTAGGTVSPYGYAVYPNQLLQLYSAGSAGFYVIGVSNGNTIANSPYTAQTAGFNQRVSAGTITSLTGTGTGTLTFASAYLGSGRPSIVISVVDASASRTAIITGWTGTTSNWTGFTYSYTNFVSGTYLCWNAQGAGA